MNLEYRRKLFGSLYGAAFLDAGNVWADEDYILGFDEESDDAPFIYSENKFRLSKLLKHMALGTGIGLRYDLDFLVVRVDWGIGLHLPYDTGKSGYFNMARFKDMNTLHLAIGYPF